MSDSHDNRRSTNKVHDAATIMGVHLDIVGRGSLHGANGKYMGRLTHAHIVLGPGYMPEYFRPHFSVMCPHDIGTTDPEDVRAWLDKKALLVDVSMYMVGKQKDKPFDTTTTYEARGCILMDVQRCQNGKNRLVYTWTHMRQMACIPRKTHHATRIPAFCAEIGPARDDK